MQIRHVVNEERMRSVGKWSCCQTNPLCRSFLADYEVFFLFALIYSEAIGNRYKVECPFPCVTDDTLRLDRHGELYTRVALALHC